MAKKIIIIILIISCLSVNVSAQYLWRSINPPNMVLGYYDNYNGVKTSGNDKTYTMYGTVYPLNGTMEWISPDIPDTSTGQPYAYMAFWQSVIQYNTIYKFSVKLDWSNSVTPEPETGIVTLRTNQYVALVPMDRVTDLDASTIGTRQRYTVKNLTNYNINGSSPTNGMYHMFYDSTSDMLSVVFISDPSVNPNLKQTNNYVYIVLGDNNYGAVTNFTVTEYTGIVETDEKTQLMREIVEKLDTMAGAAGGLTEEQINEAIQDALTAHDQQLEQEVDSKLDQIMEQINGIVSPYSEAADQINTAFDGLSDVFASSSTASVFKFPAGRMPNGVVLWKEHNIDIGAAWIRVPAKFRAVVQIVCTFTILYAVIKEAIFIIRFIILGRKGSEDD